MSTTSEAKQKKFNLNEWLACVRESNELYEKATPGQRRVMLATDVIKALESGRFRQSDLSGSYLPLDFVMEYNARYDKEELPSLIGFGGVGERCKVCALGALFVAKADRFGFSTTPPNEDDAYINSFDSVAARCREFTYEQMMDIEMAYEADHSWKDAYPLRGFRMVAVMKNIVRNSGYFKYSEVVPKQKRGQ